LAEGLINFLKKHKLDVLLIIIFFILPFIFLKDAFKLNSIILGSGDPTSYYIPLQELKANLLKSFELPFWNQYNFSGFPLLSNPQAGIFYPITFILNLIFPIALSYNLSIILSYSFAGTFVYLLLNEYKLNKLASFTAGLIFMFSGVMVTHKSHAVILYTIIWVPLILFLLEKFRKTRRFEFVLISSIFYGISFFGGHSQTFLYCSFIILVFILYYAFLYNRGKNYYFLLSGLIFVIGFLLICIQFIPSYELMKNSLRSSASYDYFTSFSFNPKLLPILFFPFLFGNHFYPLQDVPIYFGPWNYTEMVIYFGIITMPLFVFGFFVKNKHKYLWIFVLIFSFFLVLGNHTPLYKLMYYIPLFNKFRVPARNWLEFGLAFSILSGFGFNYFIKLGRKKVRKIILGLIIFFSFIFCSFFILNWLIKTSLKNFLISLLGSTSNDVGYLLQNIKLTNYSIFIPLIIISCTVIILIIFLFRKNKFLYILLIVLIFIDLFSFGYFYEGNSDTNYLSNKIEDVDGLNFLIQEKEFFRICPIAPGISGIILCNKKNIHKQLDAVTGNDTLMLRNYNFITKINESSDAVTDWQGILKNNNILSMLNVKYIVVQKTDNISEFMTNINRKSSNTSEVNLNDENDKYVIVYSDDSMILENKSYNPRFYFVNKVRNVENIDIARNILWEEDNKNGLSNFNIKETALVEDIDFDKREFNVKNTNINIIEYKNNEVIIETNSEDDSFLVFSDTYYPGWKAYIDGVENKIYKTNGILKGIYIPEGNHNIIFKYTPSFFWYGVIISTIILIAVILAIIIMFRRRNRLVNK